MLSHVDVSIQKKPFAFNLKKQNSEMTNTH